jgi:hypothetical protein
VTARPGSGVGNGDICPLDPEHGKMVMLSTGRQFCPHSDHSSAKVPQRALFEHDGVTPTKVGV